MVAPAAKLKAEEYLARIRSPDRPTDFELRRMEQECRRVVDQTNDPFVKAVNCMVVAHTLDLRGYPKEALDWYERALKLSPVDLDGANIGIVRNLLRLERYEEAVRFINLLQYDPQHPVHGALFQGSLVRALHFTGQFEKSRTLLAEILERPLESGDQTCLADVCAAIGETGLALHFLAASTRVAPEQLLGDSISEVLEGLGRIPAPSLFKLVQRLSQMSPERRLRALKVAQPPLRHSEGPVALLEEMAPLRKQANAAVLD